MRKNKIFSLVKFLIVAALIAVAVATIPQSKLFQNNNNGNNANQPPVNISDVVTNLKFNDNILTWDKLQEDEDDYYVAYYSTNIEPNLIKVENNWFSLEEIVEEHNEIIALRVGKYVDDVLQMSNVVYYNPDNYKPYTDNIYYFDGIIADYYITSQQELNHLAYYSFIYRISSLEIKFEKEFFDSISLSNAFHESYIDSFLETIYLSYRYSVLNQNNAIVKIDLNFGGAIEPTLTLQKIMVQDVVAKPYYEKVSYEKRSENYDNFATDKLIKLAPVKTSEELFWTIESGATPVFENTNSSAYKIYQKAKQILREIISDQMTDYEKLLSIFDYISYNTVYDYQVIDKEKKYTENNPSTKFRSFYLEGVFYDGLAVCDGFSKAFSLLANMEGIKTVRIVGDADGNHAWNKTLLEGKWYVVDITWTELEMKHYFTNVDTEYLAHKYFLVSDNEINTHTPYSNQSYKNFPANENYYYFKNQTFNFDNKQYDAIIDSKDDAEALIKYLWQEFKQNNNNSVSFEVIITLNITQEWQDIVKKVKNEYNQNNADKFNNDVVRIIDGKIIYNILQYQLTPYSKTKSGIVTVIQIHNTFLNLQQ